MKPKTQSTALQEELIERARQILEDDERVAACWLEGSFASGTADTWSDVDIHVAIYDERYDDFFSGRIDTLNRFRTILAHGETPLPGGSHILYATLSGPVRLDLYIERLSMVDAVPRWDSPRLLFEREPIAAKLQTTTDVAAHLPQWLEALVRNFFFGSMWPVRMWGREEWGSLLMNAQAIIFQFLVPAILAQENPKSFYRPHYHNERHLSTARRQQINAILGESLTAFGGIDEGSPDVERLVRLHARLIGAIWRELRAACEKWDVPYPEGAEDEMHGYYQRELGIEIDRS